MSLKITKASDPVLVEHVNICIYAAPGLGKTTLSFTADDPLLLDADHGSYRAANRKDIVQVSTWSDVIDFTAQELSPYKTIVVDTAGRMLDYLTADIIADNPKLGRGGALTLQGFGALKSRFAAWLKMLNTFGKDVVLLAHMDEQRQGDDVIERLDVQGGSKGEIYKSVDAMGRIFIKGKDRVIDFSPRENAFGKNPCNFEPINFSLNEPNLLGITIRLMKERINAASKEQKDAQSLLAEWAETIAGLVTAADFNDLLAELRKAPKTIQTLAAKRAKELGFVFNKLTNVYEVKEEKKETHAPTSEAIFG
jgi:hypothetical protein